MATSIRRLGTSVLLAFVVLVVGYVCLAREYRLPSLMLLIHPSSFVFYLLPESILQRLSDGAAFWLGVASALGFWSLTFFVAISLLRRISASLSLRAPSN